MFDRAKLKTKMRGKMAKKIINSCWTGLTKISWFVSGEQINLWSTRHCQITIFCNNRVQWLFYHSITKFVFTSWQLRETICNFSLESVVPITHEQNIICSKIRYMVLRMSGSLFEGCLFAGHLVGSWPMERKKNPQNDNENYVTPGKRIQVELIFIVISWYLN